MTVEPILRSTPTSSPAAKMIAVASGKGGVGKTWFAITLTHALSRAGRRTLLFDGDLGLANVDIQLGLTPKRDLAGVVGGKLTLKQAVQSYGDGLFDIVAGRSGSSGLATLPVARLNSLRGDLVQISEGYDRVVLDIGAGVDRTVQMLAWSAGTILVVTTDEPTSITDAYAFIKLTVAERPDADLRIVVNMADSQGSGEKTYDSLVKVCRRFLRVEPPLAGVVRRDQRVRDSIRHQLPILIRHPGSDAAADVEALVRRLDS